MIDRKEPPRPITPTPSISQTRSSSATQRSAIPLQQRPTGQSRKSFPGAGFSALLLDPFLEPVSGLSLDFGPVYSFPGAGFGLYGCNPGLKRIAAMVSSAFLYSSGFTRSESLKSFSRKAPGDRFRNYGLEADFSDRRIPLLKRYSRILLKSFIEAGLGDFACIVGGGAG